MIITACFGCHVGGGAPRGGGGGGAGVVLVLLAAPMAIGRGRGTALVADAFGNALHVAATPRKVIRSAMVLECLDLEAP